MESVRVRAAKDEKVVVLYSIRLPSNKGMLISSYPSKYLSNEITISQEFIVVIQARQSSKSPKCKDKRGKERRTYMSEKRTSIFYPIIFHLFCKIFIHEKSSTPIFRSPNLSIVSESFSVFTISRIFLLNRLGFANAAIASILLSFSNTIRNTAKNKWFRKIQFVIKIEK